jgi:CheY-like chemotaxis protein
LIVDDDDEVRMATQDAMERRGFEVVAVSSGAEALAFLAHDVPSIMLLDLHMDDMNGWEVLGAIRRDPRFANTEVVVVTGSEVTIAARTRVKVLRKPFKIAELMAVLETPVQKTMAS